MEWKVWRILISSAPLIDNLPPTNIFQKSDIYFDN
jgi:hypothetical protein